LAYGFRPVGTVSPPLYYRWRKKAICFWRGGKKARTAISCAGLCLCWPPDACWCAPPREKGHIASAVGQSSGASAISGGSAGQSRPHPPGAGWPLSGQGRSGLSQSAPAWTSGHGQRQIGPNHRAYGNRFGCYRTRQRPPYSRRSRIIKLAGQTSPPKGFLPSRTVIQNRQYRNTLLVVSTSRMLTTASRPRHSTVEPTRPAIYSPLWFRLCAGLWSGIFQSLPPPDASAGLRSVPSTMMEEGPLFRKWASSFYPASAVRKPGSNCRCFYLPGFRRRKLRFILIPHIRCKYENEQEVKHETKREQQKQQGQRRSLGTG